MSGQCLCSWCVEARLRARDAETADLRGLAAYDQARGNYPEIPNSSRRAQEAGALALAMREARERAGATCP